MSSDQIPVAVYDDNRQKRKIANMNNHHISNKKLNSVIISHRHTEGYFI